MKSELAINERVEPQVPVKGSKPDTRLNAALRKARRREDTQFMRLLAKTNPTEIREKASLRNGSQEE
ncbi:unnamed protein product [Bursaphelenchus okinawaensis]|uniref:Uncharacterized protein n=1 Tax=Bursaphelenchus okinawaensis TaxID=465554 RepID=A0A811LMR5_9BILA|nr:unnamed protein product [Bursaphelenchus okinawaensis]CAG9124421.1 unnamed protein product [Bursaphelenchus okinawaensis]